MFEQERDNEMSERMIRYFQQDISKIDLKELNQWLQESPENKEFFFQLKNTHDVFRYYKQSSAEEVERSWQKMENKIASSTVTPITRVRSAKAIIRSLKYIAVAAVASIVGFFFSLNYATQDILPLTPALEGEISYHEIHVGKGGKPNSITLADGTNVRLNVASTLRYPTNFSTVNREIFLDGEAWFDVAHNEEQPFIVHLQQQTITVHGTSFNIEAYQDESSHKITLLSGSVSLETNNHEGELISHLVLKPGQKASFDIAAETIAVEQVDLAVANSWVPGEYKFKDETLEQIVKRLEKYYDVNIELNDDLKNIHYTGTLSFNQRIEQVLRIINYDNRFIVQRNGSSIYITI